MTADRLAADVHAALNAHFWDDAASLYHPVLPPTLIRPEDPFHYWWQAHALDVNVDAFERDGDAAHLERAARLVAGVKRANHGSLHNDYYDDMLWMALALLRTFDATGDDAFLRDALGLWDDIRGGWNDFVGGGVAWRKTQLDYKNTPANGPAVILGARLFERTGDDAHLAFAERVMAWLHAHLVDADSGEVWDGANRQGDGRIDKDWAFTYNEGTVIGARVALWRATNHGAHLDFARTTAFAALKRYGPILPNEGTGDGALFKGILARYLAALADVDADSREAVADVLTASAEVAARHLSPAVGVPGPDLARAPDERLELSAALGGLMVAHEAARLRAFSRQKVG